MFARPKQKNITKIGYGEDNKPALHTAPVQVLNFVEDLVWKFSLRLMNLFGTQADAQWSHCFHTLSKQSLSTK